MICQYVILKDQGIGRRGYEGKAGISNIVHVSRGIAKCDTIKYES